MLSSTPSPANIPYLFSAQYVDPSDCSSSKLTETQIGFPSNFFLDTTSKEVKITFSNDILLIGTYNVSIVGELDDGRGLKISN